MGAVWDDRSLALSSKMAFANEKLRYLFWSTCLSLRVHDGHSPDRTWRLANKGGLRMIFGYETVSYDSGRYGSEFWKQWKPVGRYSGIKRPSFVHVAILKRRFKKGCFRKECSIPGRWAATGIGGSGERPKTIKALRQQERRPLKIWMCCSWNRT